MNKIHMTKPPLRDKGPVCRKLKDTNKRNQWWLKQIERYTIFLNWKNQHCENDDTNQMNIQIQCNYYQINNSIFHRTTKKSIICMETKKIPNSQSNLEKENQSWKNQFPWLQTILQSYSHHNRMVLTQKQQ